MVGGIDLGRWTDLGAVTDLDMDHVEDNAVEIEKYAVAKKDIVAEIAGERRPDHDACADAAEGAA